MWSINMCTLLPHWGRDELRAQTAFHKMLQVFVLLAFLLLKLTQILDITDRWLYPKYNTSVT